MSRTVALDAGHGPVRIGASANGVDEQAVNWILVDRIRAMLKGRVRVVLTREGYFWTPSLAYRVQKAKLARADLFISIHLNASGSPRPNGMEVYHYGHSLTGKALAGVMAWHLKDQTNQDKCRVVGSPSPDYPRTLYVLKRTTMPALLLEACYLTNPRDARLMKSPEFPEAFCRGVVRGTVACLRQLDRLK